jgi:transcriptional regulator with XRE-family HTH domain
VAIRNPRQAHHQIVTPEAVDEWERRIGAQVHTLRNRAGISQAELAQRAGVSQPTITNLERGRGSSLATLIRIATVFGRDDWLTALSGPDDATVSPVALWRARNRASRSTDGRPT